MGQKQDYLLEIFTHIEKVVSVHSTSFLIICIFNYSTFVKTYVDSDCLCYSIFDANFVHQKYFKINSIKPIPLRLANGNFTAIIIRITCVKTKISDRILNNCGYVVPALVYPIILGNPWIEQNSVIQITKSRYMRTGVKHSSKVI